MAKPIEDRIADTLLYAYADDTLTRHLLRDAETEIRRLRGENERLVKENEELTGSCSNCQAPLGPIGCEECDAELCACCIVSHEHPFGEAE